jgi:tRNA(Ile2) C34 agmatinyltransferase TiaS
MKAIVKAVDTEEGVALIVEDITGRNLVKQLIADRIVSLNERTEVDMDIRGIEPKIRRQQCDKCGMTDHEMGIDGNWRCTRCHRLWT